MMKDLLWRHWRPYSPEVGPLNLNCLGKNHRARQIYDRSTWTRLTAKQSIIKMQKGLIYAAVLATLQP